MAVSISAARARQDALPAFHAFSTTISLTNTQPRQDATPKLYRPVITLKSSAAGLGTPALAQIKNTFTATILASQSAGLGSPTFNTHITTGSIQSYSTTSPLLDSARPNVTLTSAYNFTALGISSGAAGLDLPSVAQINALANATNIASGAAGIDRPQFVQFQALTAVNLATAAAALDQPGTGGGYVLMAPQLNFASVDTAIHQINTALTGLAPSVSLASTGNLAALIKLTSPSATSLKVSAGIAMPNKTAVAAAAAMLASAQQTIPNGASISAAAIFKANAATFIFDTESLGAATSFSIIAAQEKHILTSAAANASIAAQGAILQSAIASLSGSTSLFANLVTPQTTTWSDLALLSPTSVMTAIVNHALGISVSFNSLSSLVSDIQVYVSGLGLSPVSTLNALVTARLLIHTSLSPLVGLGVSEQFFISGRSAVSSSALIFAQLSIGRPLSVGISPAVTLTSIAGLIGQVATGLAPVSHIAATEIQYRSIPAGLSPAASLKISSQTMILPSAIFTATSALSINERILPNGAAFYTAHITMLSLAAQTMTAKAAMPIAAVMSPHEGLLLNQAPAIISAATLLATKETFTIGPNLTLVSNILLSVPRLKSLAATGSNLVGETDMSIQYSFNESCAASLINGSFMTMLPSTAVAGLSNMFTGCFFNIDMTQQRVVEQGPIIIAQKSNNNRIVAQGNLVILTN